MKNKYGLKSSTKYDWRTIDCKKMPDYKSVLRFGTEFYTNEFYGPSMFDSAMFDTSTLMAQNIEADYIRYSRGFDVSEDLMQVTNSEHYQIHHYFNRDDLINNGTK